MGGKIAESIVTGISKCIDFLVEGALELEPVLVVVAMAGIFVTMVGGRKVGTKLTSGAIIIYTILKVVSIC